MKISFLIFAIFAISLALAQDDDDEKVFQDYVKKFKFRFGRNGNAEKAKRNVIKKYKEIREQNKKFKSGEETFEAELNELSYKDPEDIARENLGYIEPPPSNETRPPPPLLRSRRAVLPDYFDWKDRGVVRDVQNQGSCGSCYAFAAIGALESRACITKGQCGKLSEQEAMECTNGCKGGWDDWVYKYAQTYDGCALSSYYYTSYVRSACSSALTRPRVAGTEPSTWIWVQGYGEEKIREYLQNYGPMFIVFEVYENFYSYKTGIYGSVGGQYLGTHAVLLTGWGTENGIPYWNLRNSWGSWWGENGYFRMRRGINLGRIETIRVSVPLLV